MVRRDERSKSGAANYALDMLRAMTLRAEEWGCCEREELASILPRNVVERLGVGT